VLLASVLPKDFDDIEEEEDAPGVVLQYVQARVRPRIGLFCEEEGLVLFMLIYLIYPISTSTFSSSILTSAYLPALPYPFPFLSHQ
jgi:hypothetical protein